MKALLLVDIQLGLDELDFYGGSRNNLQAEANCARVLEFFREKAWPVIHVKHNSTIPASPLYPGKPGNAIKAIVQPLKSEPLIQKNVNSAFIGTGLKENLDSKNITEIIIIGMTTNHCISSTARMSSNLGFSTTVISDATAAFDTIGIDGTRYDAELIHQTALASLNDEFATIVDTKTLIEDLKG